VHLVNYTFLATHHLFMAGMFSYLRPIVDSANQYQAFLSSTQCGTVFMCEAY
jgi:hypothetical protein